jgi:hypothetical protein
MAVWPVRMLCCASVIGSLAAYGCMGACDIFATSSKELAGGYCLELNREFDHYRLQKCSGVQDAITSGVGRLHGTVERIGWNDRYIVGWRTPVFGGDKAGWMILDTSNGQIEGPLSQPVFEATVAERPALRGIVTSPCSDVLK